MSSDAHQKPVSSPRRTGIILAVGLAAGVVASGSDSVAARSSREIVEARPAGVPLMAIVALGEQRITVYDAQGKILQAPVSSGQTGYETPAGVYSVIQKEAEHYSNLYDDASMPFMQRITWSGIALHAGVLPGHPASHGCVRMPYEFAQHLFDKTSKGMRVIVVPRDVVPADITHPSLFKPKTIEVDLPALTLAGTTGQRQWCRSQAYAGPEGHRRRQGVRGFIGRQEGGGSASSRRCRGRGGGSVHEGPAHGRT